MLRKDTLFAFLNSQTVANGGQLKISKQSRRGTKGGQKKKKLRCFYHSQSTRISAIHLPLTPLTRPSLHIPSALGEHFGLPLSLFSTLGVSFLFFDETIYVLFKQCFVFTCLALEVTKVEDKQQQQQQQQQQQ
jgi:hypothetical protein